MVPVKSKEEILRQAPKRLYIYGINIDVIDLRRELANSKTDFFFIDNSIYKTNRSGRNLITKFVERFPRVTKTFLGTAFIESRELCIYENDLIKRPFISNVTSVRQIALNLNRRRVVVFLPSMLWLYFYEAEPHIAKVILTFSTYEDVIFKIKSKDRDYYRSIFDSIGVELPFTDRFDDVPSSSETVYVCYPGSTLIYAMRHKGLASLYDPRDLLSLNKFFHEVKNGFVSVIRPDEINRYKVETCPLLTRHNISVLIF